MLCQVTEKTAATSKTLEMIKYQHMLSQSVGYISPTWVRLHNQSTVNVFSNRHLLNNISKSDKKLAIFSAGVHTNTNLKGDIPGYGLVWFRPGGIANILPLSKVAKRYRVSYYSTGANDVLVYLPMGEVISFQKCNRGLLYSNMAMI